MLRRFSSLYPKKIKLRIINILGFCGYKKKPEKIIGKTVLISLIVSFFLSIIISIFTFFFLLPILFVGFVLIINLGFFVFTSVYATKRAKNVENILPGFLDLFAMNVSAGMSISDSFIMSARPEYGYFAEEIRLAGRKISLGKTFESALIEMTKRIKSSELEKTMNLIVSTKKSGGKIKETLKSIAKDLRNRQLIANRTNQELKGNIRSFLVMVVFLVPALYALQNLMMRLVSGLSKEMSKLGGLDTTSTFIAGAEIGVSGINMDPLFLLWFAIIAITVKCIMGSMIIGYITKGEIKEGLRISPVLIIVAIVMFFLVKIGMSGLFINLS